MVATDILLSFCVSPGHSSYEWEYRVYSAVGEQHDILHVMLNLVECVLPHTDFCCVKGKCFDTTSKWLLSYVPVATITSNHI